MNLQWTHSFWTGVECVQMHVYIQYSLSPYFSLPFQSCFLFFLFCCLLFVLSLPPCTPHTAPAWKVQDVLPICMYMCVYMTHCAPAETPNTIRTSPSDLPHLLSRQVVSTPRGKLSFSLCLSVSLNLSLSRLFNTHTQTARTHVLTHHCARIQRACYWDICQCVGWLTSVIQL